MWEPPKEVRSEAPCSPIKSPRTLSFICSRFTTGSKQYRSSNHKSDSVLLRKHDSCEPEGENVRKAEWNRDINGGYSVTGVWQRWLVEWWNNSTYRKPLSLIQGWTAGSTWAGVRHQQLSESSATAPGPPGNWLGTWAHCSNWVTHTYV